MNKKSLCKSKESQFIDKCRNVMLQSEFLFHQGMNVVIKGNIKHDEASRQE